MPTNPNQKLLDETARINAEKALVEAQEALAKAKAELAEANKPPDAAAAAHADELSRLTRLKEKEAARKELAESRKANDLAEAQALVGSVGKSDIEGTVTLKDDAGKGEAMLLSSRALASAAEKIAADITDTSKSMILVPDGDYLQFGAYQQFLLEIELMNGQFDAAAKHAESLMPQREKAAVVATEAAAVAPLTLAGAAVEALANLGSFFKADYEIGGINIDKDVEQLIAALGGALRRKRIAVMVPRGQVPQSSDYKKLVGDLSARIDAAELSIAAFDALAAQKSAAADTGSGRKAELDSEAARLTQAATATRAVVTRAGTFIAALGTPDANGVLPITKVAQQKAICDALTAGSLMLVVHVWAAAGGYYTKKNLWTFFGGMPFFAMGGAVATYQLIDKDGNLHASGLVPRHGGYTRVSEVPGIVNGGF